MCGKLKHICCEINKIDPEIFFLDGFFNREKLYANIFCLVTDSIGDCLRQIL